MPQPRTRTWSVPTSPRSPSKLVNEIGLISRFEGKLWDKTAQIDFAEELRNASFYEGSVSPNNPDFAARDRVNRSPKTFGFVVLQTRQPLVVTLAGRQLEQGLELEDLFLRQLLKWQYPSPNHRDPDYRELFCIKPFLEMLRLIDEVGYLTKTEIGLFGVTLIQYQDYDAHRDALLKFRSDYTALPNQAAKKAFVDQQFWDVYNTVYAEDIANGRVSTRETVTDGDVKAMLRKKIRNGRADYADSAIRYFAATGLFTVSTHHYRLALLPERMAEVKHLLATIPREPEDYSDAAAFYTYLGDPRQPVLPSDALPGLVTRFKALYASVPTAVQRASARQKVLMTQDPIVIKAALADLNAAAVAFETAEQQRQLRTPQVVSDILTFYQQLKDPKNASGIPDRPLYLEWNTWRAMSFLNDGEVRNNFKLDRLGNPISSAPGRGADITCSYRSFELAVEVTLSSGARQYDMEGEPVQRHVGRMQKDLRDQGNLKPVYGLFIADKIHEDVVIHFFNLHRIPNKGFGGAVSVIPLPTAVFTMFLQDAAKFSVTATIQQQQLGAFFETAKQVALAADDEVAWYTRVQQLAATWFTAPVAE